jgi:hypothetical protein
MPTIPKKHTHSTAQLIACQQFQTSTRSPAQLTRMPLLQKTTPGKRNPANLTANSVVTTWPENSPWCVSVFWQRSLPSMDFCIPQFSFAFDF